MRISSRAVGAALAVAMAMTASVAKAEQLSFDLQVRELVQTLFENDLKTCKSVNGKLMKLIADPRFEQQAPRTQAMALFAVMACSPKASDQEVVAARRLAKLPVDDFFLHAAQSALMDDARRREDPAAFIAALETAVEVAPAKLADSKPRDFSWILLKVKDDPVQEARLLDALHAVPWTNRDMREMDKNGWAVRRARRLVEAGDTSKARAQLAGVTSPDSLMNVYQDRRFAPLWPQLEADGRFDWVKLVELAMVDEQAWMKAEPNALQPVSEVIGSLRALKRYDDAIALGETYAARLRKGETFTDSKDQRSWMLNSLAYLYFDLGRYDEADKVVLEAAGDEDTVSQAINRAEMLNDAGRADQALKALDQIDPKQSSKYGLMWIDSGRACAKAQLGDKAGAEALLPSLRARWKDNAAALTDALLCLDAQDEAAAFYVRRLEDPVERAGALRAFRSGVPTPARAPRKVLIEARRDTVMARPEVAAALAKWGRALKTPLGGDV